MKDFGKLLDRLTCTPTSTGKLTLMRNYFRATPDPDRGYGLAALTGELPLSFPLRRVVSELAGRRFDAELFRLSRAEVGDTAETVALMWPDNGVSGDGPRLSQIVVAMSETGRASHIGLLTQWLDQLDTTGRWALLRLLGGTLRAGVSPRLARLAVAEAFGHDVEDIEVLWHGLEPPYLPLFAWLEGRAPRPAQSSSPVFRPLMLANPLDDADWEQLDIDHYAAEWKWDGIRVQVSGKGGMTRLFSRSGDDISASFPDLIEGFQFDAVLDGELLIVREGKVAAYAELQRRLNRKAVSRRVTAKYPAHVRFYDALEIGGEDLRGLSFSERRQRLEVWHAAHAPLASDLSELLAFGSKDALRQMWEKTRGDGIEGLMLKRRDSPYLAGRPKGHWYKWKCAALTADCVLLYVQRGAGERSLYYSDYTFGAWTEADGVRVLVPVGKAHSSFADAELVELDSFIRQNTADRFGPVRSVTPKLVLEVAFDAVQVSPRHKSGITMRFPRIARIRWDKPAAEADTLEYLKRLIA